MRVPLDIGGLTLSSETKDWSRATIIAVSGCLIIAQVLQVRRCCHGWLGWNQNIPTPLKRKVHLLSDFAISLLRWKLFSVIMPTGSHCKIGGCMSIQTILGPLSWTGYAM